MENEPKQRSDSPGSMRGNASHFTKLPYVNRYVNPKNGDRIWLYFLNNCSKKREVFKSLRGVRIYPNGALPTSFLEEYKQKVVEITTERLKRIDSGVFQKQSTGVLEMAINAGLTKSEILKLIDENIKE